MQAEIKTVTGHRRKLPNKSQKRPNKRVKLILRWRMKNRRRFRGKMLDTSVAAVCSQMLSLSWLKRPPLPPPHHQASPTHSIHPCALLPLVCLEGTFRPQQDARQPRHPRPARTRTGNAFTALTDGGTTCRGPPASRPGPHRGL